MPSYRQTEEHSMWLTLAIGYCVMCWIAGYFLNRYLPALELVHGARSCGFSRISFQVLFVMIMPIAAPFLPIFIWRGLWDGITITSQMRSAHRTFREYEFIHVDGRDLPGHIPGHFVSHTPELRRLDFCSLGDFRLQPPPMEIFARLFLSEDGEIFASVYAYHYADYSNSTFVAVLLVSVLENGTCVHTCSAENPYPGRTVEPGDQLRESYMAGASVEVLYGRHRRVVQEMSAGGGRRALRFRPSQLREVGLYDQFVYCRWRYRHGDLDREPPAPDIHTLVRLEPCVEIGRAKNEGLHIAGRYLKDV
jgi:hypothetical protein